MLMGFYGKCRGAGPLSPIETFMASVASARPSSEGSKPHLDRRGSCTWKKTPAAKKSPPLFWINSLWFICNQLKKMLDVNDIMYIYIYIYHSWWFGLTKKWWMFLDVFNDTYPLAIQTWHAGKSPASSSWGSWNGHRLLGYSWDISRQLSSRSLLFKWWYPMMDIPNIIIAIHGLFMGIFLTHWVLLSWPKNLGIFQMGQESSTQ